MEVELKAGTVFQDDMGKVTLKKDMLWNLEELGKASFKDKIFTVAFSREELLDKLNSLLPYMWRNWVSPYEDNFNGMKDFLEEYLDGERKNEE